MMGRQWIGRLSVLTMGFCFGVGLGWGSVTLGAATLGSVLFSDVPAGASYDEALGELASHGVLQGKEDGLFHPDDYVTRSDLALVFKKFHDAYVKGTQKSEVRSRSSQRSSRSSRRAASSAPASSFSSSSVSPSGVGVQFAVSSFSIMEKAKQVSVSVIRKDLGGTSLRVDYATEDGEALAGEDYTNTTGSVSFAPNEMSKIIAVVLKDDTLSEAKETFRIVFKNPTGGVGLGSTSVVTVTIVDDDAGNSIPAPSSSSIGGGAGGSGPSFVFGSSQYSVSEAGGSIAITVVFSGVTTGAHSVNYATSDGSAQGGGDYTPVSGKIDFAAGETTQTFSVPILDDKDIGGMKTVNLILRDPSSGSSVGNPGTAILMIVDDESTGAPFGIGSVKLSKASSRVGEVDRSATISVQRVGGSVGSVSVDYATSDGTAMGGVDYTNVHGTLTFAPGETIKTFTVPVLRDDIDEGDETVSIILSNPTGGAQFIVPSTGILTIGG